MKIPTETVPVTDQLPDSDQAERLGAPGDAETLGANQDLRSITDPTAEQDAGELAGELHPRDNHAAVRVPIQTAVTIEAPAADYPDTDDETGEIDLDYDEDRDFDTRTSDRRVPTDLVSAYTAELNGEILSKEKVIERAKDVEAGLTAGVILRINEAVDDPDDTALLTWRDDYIETRQQNVRLGGKGGKKDSAEEDGESADAEAESHGQKAGKPAGKNKQLAEKAARAREERQRIAENEADEMIALALRYRVPDGSGGTTLPEDLRRDLEEVDRRGAQAKIDMIRSIEKWTFKQSMKHSGQGQRVGFSPIDIVQEGNMGAIRAVEKYDYTKGFSLTTYSTWWTRQAISRALAYGDLVRRPVHITEELSRVQRAETELRAMLQPGEELTEEMIAEKAKIKVERLAELRQIDQRPLSLDRRVDEDDSGSNSLGDYFEDNSADELSVAVAEADRRAKLRAAVDDALEEIGGDPRIAVIVRARFGLSEGSDGVPLTLDEIGREMGLTRERIRQLEKIGMNNIRDNEAVMARLRALR